MGPYHLGLAAPVTFPTGSADDFLGDDGFTVSPTLVAALHLQKLWVALNVGYRVRGDRSFEISSAQRQVRVDDDLQISLGLQVPLWRGRLDALADALVAMSIAEQDEEEVPAELMFGLRAFLPAGFTLDLGAGPGLTQGVGTPAFRLLLGLGWRTPDPPPKPKKRKPSDRDGDGILDVDDQCPDEPEDKDGFEDQDGCPDPDNDQDKILDVDDACPNDPETYNEYQDQDGCPDKGPGPAQIVENRIEVAPVFFATDQDIIEPRSFQTLVHVANVLKRNSWIKKVRIEGHTDAVGTHEYNLDLSQRRVLSVMRFLVQQGIAPARLEAIGHGKTKPIADNTTEEGRAKNRRVEFIIVDPKM